ncbi:hypothetical protein GF324_00250 [bacterium]|nr:hypothetical protein [bacterium]
MKDQLSEQLLQRTREARHAAQVDHEEKMMGSLMERRRLIAEMFGLDASRPLPPPDDSRISPEIRQWGRRHRKVLEEVKQEEQLLMKALHAKRERLLQGQGEVRLAGRYAEGMRATVYHPINGRSMDLQG